MARQTINIGTAPRDRTGDTMREAGAKINANFIELYAGSGGGGSGAWENSYEANNGITLSTHLHSAGRVITFTASPYQYSNNLVTYDTVEDSQYVNFVWDEDFINNIWEGNHYGYQISLDSGNTWVNVETSGYSGGQNFYFSTPYDSELDGHDTPFTYDAGDETVSLRYRDVATSANSVWFDPNDLNSNTFTLTGYRGAKIDFVAQMTTVAPYESTAVAVGQIWAMEGAYVYDGDDVRTGPYLISDQPRVTVLSGADVFDADDWNYVVEFDRANTSAPQNLDQASAFARQLVCRMNSGYAGTVTIMYEARIFASNEEE